MDDRLVERHRGALTLSTDRNRLDLDAVFSMLRAEHWGDAVTRERLERSIANSVCVGVYEGGVQVAFARIVTDLATYGYLTDVVVASAHRERGIGRWMVETILAHPDLQGVRRFALLTRDAQALYAPFGFTTTMGKSTYMELRDPPMRGDADGER